MSPAFLIGFDGEKVRAAVVFGIFFLDRQGDFAGGFAIFGCFMVVKSW